MRYLKTNTAMRLSAALVPLSLLLGFCQSTGEGEQELNTVAVSERSLSATGQSSAEPPGDGEDQAESAGAPRAAGQTQNVVYAFIDGIEGSEPDRRANFSGERPAKRNGSSKRVKARATNRPV